MALVDIRKVLGQRVLFQPSKTGRESLMKLKLEADDDIASMTRND
jgi:hypothetical protein